MQNKSGINMKKIYKQIAKEHGVSVKQVKKDILEAINEAYTDPTFNAKCVPCKGEVPTPEELVKYIAERIQLICPVQSDN